MVAIDLWQWHCQNRRKKKFVAMTLPKQRGKKLWQLICGNGIAEIEGKKKFVGMDLWQWHCRNRREKKLLQLICRKLEERENCLNKKKYSIHILILQQFFLLKQFGLCVCHVLSFCIVKVPYETNNDRFKYIEYIDTYS